MAEETPDVPKGEDVVGTGNDARLKMLEQINDRNDAVLAQEGQLADINDDGTTTPTDSQVIQQELDRAQAEINQVAEPEVSVKHKIKVNGKEVELTTDELIARAQKVESADEYLKEASEKLRDAESRKTPESEPSNADVQAQALERKRALVRAIQMGTEEEAMAAIEELSGHNPSVSADDIARTVDERLTFKTAVERFQTEYKDLVEDPILMNIVLTRDKELLAQGDKRGYWERYDEIGKSVRTWHQSIVDKAKASVKQPENDKLARKQSAPSAPPSAAQKAPAVVDDEDKEETASEIIAAIAKARGGPQWLRG